MREGLVKILCANTENGRPYKILSFNKENRRKVNVNIKFHIHTYLHLFWNLKDPMFSPVQNCCAIFSLKFKYCSVLPSSIKISLDILWRIAVDFTTSSKRKKIFLFLSRFASGDIQHYVPKLGAVLKGC